MDAVPPRRCHTNKRSFVSRGVRRKARRGRGRAMNAPVTADFTLRAATPDDVDGIFRMIQGLAAYEHLTHAVTGGPERLRGHLFGERRYAEVILAEADGRSVGFALFFHSYSTFLTAPGLYLEDLFVEPAYRGRGIGAALLESVART